MIAFACAHCGKNLSVADTSAGKRARCLGCRQVTVVPGTVAVADTRGESAQRPRPDEGATQAPRPVRADVTLGGDDTRPAQTPGKVVAQVPGYEILGELGRGGMGVVYKARQERPRRVVALKMILSGEHASADALRRFRAEAEAVARLQHPHIVAVHEVGDHNGHPYFSLEFVEGGSLAEALRARKFKARAAAELLLQLAKAVEYAHKRGIVHRDLKPANILLARDEDEQGRWLAKVADFGLAKQMDEFAGLSGAPRTQSGAIMGTPAYMAPEQAAAKAKEIGPASDVYSLGAILYEMLTGKVPFEAGSALDTLIKVATEDPTPPRQINSKLPRDLETICLKCMRKDPKQRYGGAKELADDLRRFLDGQPIEARPMGGFERLTRWLGKRKEVVTIAAASLAAVAVVVMSVMLLAPGKKNAAKTGAGQTDDDDDDTSGNPGAIGKIRAAANRQISSNNLKQLAIGMHNFASAYNYLPPAAICDPTGKALLSWRVLMLPYIEQDVLYKQFKLTEAWDSAHNKKLLDKMPKTFEIPDSEAAKGSTYYRVFTGPGTVFDTTGSVLGGPFGGRGSQIQRITDGTSNTILIVEANSAVPWTKPEELDYSASKPVPKLGAGFADSSLAAMADGAVIGISKKVKEVHLRRAITMADGELLPPDWNGMDAHENTKTSSSERSSQPPADGPIRVPPSKGEGQGRAETEPKSPPKDRR